MKYQGEKASGKGRQESLTEGLRKTVMEGSLWIMEPTLKKWSHPGQPLSSSEEEQGSKEEREWKFPASGHRAQ